QRGARGRELRPAGDVLRDAHLDPVAALEVGVDERPPNLNGLVARGADEPVQLAARNPLAHCGQPRDVESAGHLHIEAGATRRAPHGDLLPGGHQGGPTIRLITWRCTSASYHLRDPRDGALGRKVATA